MNAKTAIVAFLVGLLCIAAQISVAHRLGVLGARPAFDIVALVAFSPFLNRSQGAWLGFALGFFLGAGIGANLSQYVASRTSTGFAVAWFNDVRLQPGVATLAATAAAATVFSSIVFMLFAPPSGIGKYLTDTILSAVYNGVLVWPLYVLLRRILDPVYR